MTAEETEHDKKRKRREMLLALFALLLLDTHHTLNDYATRFLTGALTLTELHDALVTHLAAAHAHAAYLGRSLAGSRKPFGSADQQFAASVMFGQVLFLSGLLQDLQGGKYRAADDGTLPNALTARLWAYCVRCYGTANEAWGLTLGPDARFLWFLGVNVEHHCDVCPERQAESQVEPYTLDTIPGWPGDCSTPCLWNCDCTVKTTDGEECFPYPGGSS